LFSSCREDEELPIDATAAPLVLPAAAEPTEPYIAPRVTRASGKKVTQARNLKRSKKAKETDVSLEAHTSTVSPDDVSNSSLLAFLAYTPALTHFFSLGIIEEICRLGH
jgi:hypothetical protein